jgi:allophanate hydrolase subunit 2
VQLTPDGRLIILLADCQTTGGYPRVLQLSFEALSVMAQLGPGAELQFRR